MKKDTIQHILGISFWVILIGGYWFYSHNKDANKISGLGDIKIGAETNKGHYHTENKSLPLGFESYGVRTTVKSSQIYSVYYHGQYLSVDRVISRVAEKYANCTQQSYELFKCPADEAFLTSLVPEISTRTASFARKWDKWESEPDEKSFRWYEVFRVNDKRRHIGVFVLVVQKKEYIDEPMGYSGLESFHTVPKAIYNDKLSDVILVAWDEDLIEKSVQEQKEKEIDGI